MIKYLITESEVCRHHLFGFCYTHPGVSSAACIRLCYTVLKCYFLPLNPFPSCPCWLYPSIISVVFHSFCCFKLLFLPSALLSPEKYLPEFLLQTERGLCEKTEGKYFPVRTEQTRLIRNLLYDFWLAFLPIFNRLFVVRCCSLPYFVTSSLGFLFQPVKRSFIVFFYN